MSMKIPVPESDVLELLDWANEAVEGGVTEFEDGTYEAGVLDAIRWMLGETHSRPDEV